MFHYAVGYATIIMSVITIMKGFNISEPPKDWKTGNVALIIALGGTEVVLELLKLWRFISRRRSPAAEQEINKSDVILIV